MQPVNFSTGQLTEPAEDDRHTVVIIEYNDLKSFALYLDMPLDEAKARFTQRMNDRAPYEAQHEGWDAKVSRFGITDEIHICGDWNDQVKGFMETYGISGLKD
ncbi:hypothetical protein [Marinobacter salicampi]|uniref:hypothetical protein n=1 Tax=Marinobacter salicampi TaxID=435907 RepID=UPI001408D6A0|nr:hypothetical protein [Marinobacter salicampi]